MILGVIVTYNPIFADLEKNIIAIKGQLDKLVVFDNKSISQDKLVSFCQNLDIEIIVSSQNVGLGAAYNAVFRRDFSDFDYFVTFDQDTLIGAGTINTLLPLFAIEENVGIVGPSFVKKHSQINLNYSFVDSLIQSCSVFSKEIFIRCGFFNEKLFIDSVDFEYCLRVQLIGYKIIRSNRVFIGHDLGVSKKKYGLSYIEHSALRNYYIARNHKYLTFKYLNEFPYFILKKNFFFGVHLLKLVFLDQDFNKLKSVIKGLNEKVNQK